MISYQIIEHGKPLIFGKDRDKGIRMNGVQLEVVTLGGEVKEDDLVFHDEIFEERFVALPRLHRGALDGFVGGLPFESALGELQQNRLRVVESASDLQVSLHVVGIDD